MFSFGSDHISESHIIFARGSNDNNSEWHFALKKGSNSSNSKFSFGLNSIKKSKFIYLLDEKSFYSDILKHIPRTFKLTTNNEQSLFNILLLTDTSSTIFEFLTENPNATEYHINIDYKDNILKKFEQLYQGDNVVFEEEELSICKKITSQLNIKFIPNYLKPENLKLREFYNSSLELESGVVLNSRSLQKFISKPGQKTFTIIVNDDNYKCNYFGVFSSKVIRDLIEKDPTTTQ